VSACTINRADDLREKIHFLSRKFARSVMIASQLGSLARMLETAKPADWEPWLDLAQGQLRRGRFADAERSLSTLLERRPEDPQALEWLALVRAGQGRTDEGIEILRRVVAAHAGRPEAEYNLG